MVESEALSQEMGGKKHGIQKGQRPEYELWCGHVLAWDHGIVTVLYPHLDIIKTGLFGRSMFNT